MKKIILATIFSLLSFNLMAENFLNNYKYTRRNSFSLAFSSTGSLRFTNYNTDKLELNTKFNINLAYLRKLNILDNRLSIGFDLLSNISRRYHYEYTEEDDLDRFEIKLKTNLIANILADLEILRLSKFSTSVQLGGGVSYKYFYREEYIADIYHRDKILKKRPHVKIGLVGYYNIVDGFAIGAGVHYSYTGYIKFSDSMKIRNNGVTTTDIKLKYSF